MQLGGRACFHSYTKISGTQTAPVMTPLRRAPGVPLKPNFKVNVGDTAQSHVSNTDETKTVFFYLPCMCGIGSNNGCRLHGTMADLYVGSLILDCTLTNAHSNQVFEKILRTLHHSPVNKK